MSSPMQTKTMMPTTTKHGLSSKYPIAERQGLTNRKKSVIPKTRELPVDGSLRVDYRK